MSAQVAPCVARALPGHLDFPTPSKLPGTLPPPEGEPKDDPWPISLADLIQARLLHPPVQLQREYKGHHLVAGIERDGRVSCLGNTYDSPSMAAGATRASVIGRRASGKLPATNGWSFWRFQSSVEGMIELDVVRQRYEASSGSVSEAKRPRRSG